MRCLAPAMTALAVLVSACSLGGGETEAEPERDVPALGGLERNVDDGQRRVDTTIDPGELEPPPAPEPTIGNLRIPCGAAVGTRVQSPDPGVTSSTITIGTGSDRGGLYTSGSGRSLADAVRALADRCNALGGIAGRQILVVEHDAAVVELSDHITTSCLEEFALVGHGFLLDTSVDAQRAECGLPSFPAWTTMRSEEGTPGVAAIPSQPATIVLDGISLAATAAGLDPGDGEIAVVGLLVPDSPGGLDAATRMEAAVSGAELELTTSVRHYAIDKATRWDSVVADLRAAGTAIVWVEGACTSVLVPFAAAAAEAGWRPAIVGGPDIYDPYCVAENAELLDAVMAQMAVHPGEDRIEVPAVDEHVQMLRSAGVAPTAGALRAASAFWLWATAVEECGDPLTRACVVAKADAVSRWTAGGLHRPTDPGSVDAAQCIVVLSVVDGSFTRLAPVTPPQMNCRPEVAVTVG